MAENSQKFPLGFIKEMPHPLPEGCNGAGCSALGSYVFIWPARPPYQVRRACREHRAQGEAWLAKVKGESAANDAATVERTTPAQRKLFG